MWKIRKKRAPIQCLKVESTHLAIEDIGIVTRTTWLLAPPIKQHLDTWDHEERFELV
jgi:hypothetical protein